MMDLMESDTVLSKCHFGPIWVCKAGKRTGGEGRGERGEGRGERGEGRGERGEVRGER